tara:strand:- start:97 stop:720 length:624 start_codon:yes stop_codon:yes gene_type:complete
MIPENYWLYLQILFFLFITPGSPRVVMCSYTMTYGLKKSVWTAFGDISANSIQLFFVVFGLGLLIKDNSFILTALKWAGVTYLLYLAYDLYYSKSQEINKTDIFEKNILSFFKDGFFVAGLSPKAWVFFGVIFIQFLDYNLSLIYFSIQLAILWFSYIFLDFISLVIYGISANKIATWLNSNPKTINIVSAIALVFIALFVALFQKI